MADDQRQEDLKAKALAISNYKSLAEQRGDKPVTTTFLVKALEKITETLATRAGKLESAAVKQFLPVEQVLSQVNDLLSSKTEGDLDAAFSLIEKMKSNIGEDLSKYSDAMSKNIEKLYALNEKDKAKKAEDKRIKVEKTQELTIERDILREKGINTYINEKTLVLEMKSKKEEKIEVRRIEKEAKDLLKERKELAREAKDLQKQDTITDEQNEKYLIRQENLAEKEKINKRDAERANIKPPNERTRGPLDQTVGEAFRQIGTFGKEIKQLGGDILGGFKKSFSMVGDAFSAFGRGFKSVGGSLMKGFGALAGVTKGLILGFVGLFIVLIKFVLIAVVVGIIAYVIYKIVKVVYDAISDFIDSVMKVVNKVKNFFGMGPKKDDPKKAGDPLQKDEKGETLKNDQARDVDVAAQEDGKNAVGDYDKSVIAKSLPGGDKLQPSMSESIMPITKEQGLTEVTMQNRAAEEKSSKSANNTVIAPNISNSSVSGSQTSVMSLDPVNNDRSFINLNSVPV